VKFRQLESIAHNLADSLGSGVGLLVGIYELDIFGEARRSVEGYITVDFLKGTTSRGPALLCLGEGHCSLSGSGAAQIVPEARNDAGSVR
jgi:hypothetical protein